MANTRQHRSAFQVWLKHLLQLGIGLALFGILLYLGGPDSLQKLTQLRGLSLVGAFFCTLAIAGSIAGRWGTIAFTLAGRHLAPWNAYLYYFFLNRTLGFFLPKDLTDLGGRAMALHRLHGVPFSLAGASVFFDRVFDVAILILFLPAALAYWTGWISIGVAVGMMVSAAASLFVILGVAHRQVVVGSIRLLNWGIAQLSRIWKSSPRPLRILEMTRPALRKAYILSLVKFASTVLRSILFSQALETPIPSHVLLLGTPVGQLGYLFAFTPGGLGIFEAGWYALFSIAGIPKETAILFLVEQRVLTYLCVLVWTLISYVYNALVERKKTTRITLPH